MKRRDRLFVLIGVGVGTGVLIFYLGNYYIANITDFTAKATILGGVLTLLGTVYTAVYNEISSYYKDQANNYEKKWNLIYPLVKQDYNPWILSAKSLHSGISKLSPAQITNVEILHLLYIVAVFYSNRLRFITGDGGLIILLSTKQAATVNEAYYNILENFDWAGDETSLRVSELQSLFISKDKKEDPYVLFKFVNDVNDVKESSLRKSRDDLEKWLKNYDNIRKVVEALDYFIRTFEANINKVYSAWET